MGNADGQVPASHGLIKRGPLEEGMANHFSILALRTPWTVWKGHHLYLHSNLLSPFSLYSLEACLLVYAHTDFTRDCMQSKRYSLGYIKVCHPISIPFFLITNINLFSSREEPSLTPSSTTCFSGRTVKRGKGPGLTTEDASGMLMRSFQSYESHIYLFCLNHLRIKVFFSFSLTWVLWKSSLDLPGFLPEMETIQRKIEARREYRFSLENNTWDPLSLREGWCLPWSKPISIFFFFCPSLFEFEFSIPCKLERLSKYNGSLMEFSNVIVLIAAPIYLQTPKSHHNG